MADQARDVVTWKTVKAGISVVTMERPPANALGIPLLDGLHLAMDAAEKAGDVKVMIITSAREGFFAAGADIKHLSSIDADSFTAYGDKMREVNDRLAAASWISIAAVDGIALGGGLELAGVFDGVEQDSSTATVEACAAAATEAGADSFVAVGGGFLVAFLVSLV